MIYRQIALLVTTGFFALAAAATTVPPANVVMSAGCTFETDNYQGNTPGTVGCNVVSSSQFGTVVNTASVSSVGSGTPAFFAQSSVDNTDTLINPVLTSASASLFLTYSFVVHSTQPTPFDIAAVPVMFKSTGSIEREGDTVAFGQVAAMRSAGFFDGVFIDDSTTSLDYVYSDNYLTDAAYEVLVYFSCYSSVNGVGSASCSASAATSLLLDQALFDATYGSDAFTLADYFAIETSPGLVTVPLPAAGVLFLAAIGVLPWMRGSGRRG